MDLSNLLTETDAPYFVPGHLRSKYPLGLPGFAYHAAAQVALIRDIPVAWVLKANKQNVKELYAIDVDNLALDASKLSSNKEDSVTPKYNQTRKNGYEAPVASCEGPLKLERQRDRNKSMDGDDREKAYEEAVKKLPKPRREFLADSFKRVKAKLPSRN